MFRSNLLGALSRDSQSISLYDIQQCYLGSEDVEPSVIERSVQLSPSVPISSFSWHPENENNLPIYRIVREGFVQTIGSRREEQDVQRPATADVGTGAAQVPKDLPVGAAGVLQGVGRISGVTSLRARPATVPAGGGCIPRRTSRRTFAPAPARSPPPTRAAARRCPRARRPASERD